jgi:hypothetical protein
MSKKCDQGDAGALRAGFSLILGLVAAHSVDVILPIWAKPRLEVSRSLR